MKFSSVFKLKKWVGLFIHSRCSRLLPDKTYLKLAAYASGLKINLDNPRTYNEKLQWLKLHNRKPEYTRMVDKYEAKRYVAEKIGEEYIIPTLGVWDKFEDIDFDSLPDSFVLKCTHDSGGLVICYDKAKLDLDYAKNKINKSLKQNYYWRGREWPYKNVKPRIIAEKFMVDGESECLTDYKFFCFGGEPKFMYRSMDKAKDPRTDFFDMDYNRLDMRMRDPNSDTVPPMPECFEEMKRLSRILSAGIPHLRVDFYEIGGKIYFGELTFYHCGGFVKIQPEEWMTILGDWIDLSECKER
ncbi:MAG: glycosyl transferase [Clostridia bacterium]|nr:glycosyl transferase [Clostridia bacterium]